VSILSHCSRQATLGISAFLALIAFSSLGASISAAEPLVTNQVDQSETTFLMRVDMSMGGGFGVLPNGTFGPIRRMDLIGPALRGTPPPAGATVVVARVRHVDC